MQANPPSTPEAQSIEQDNRARLIAYFESGIAEDNASHGLGVEIEHFVVQKDTLAPVHYEAHDGLPGVKDILAHMQQFYPEASYNLKGELLGLANDTANLTLEPAAQLEISIAPYEDVAPIEAAYQAFRQHIDPYLDEQGCQLFAAGYHPSAKALDLPLIPKVRYRFMNEHFAKIGSHGERMMRASGSTQVSVDYFSEADAVRKLRIATAIGPVIAALCDNIPTFEGEPNSERLARLNLWRDVDNDRCGAIPGVFDEGFGFASYADWLLGTSPIFVTRAAADDPDGPWLRGVSGLTAAEAYRDAPMEESDIEHLSSMFWPDVRLKRFVEIRQADCLPAAQVYAYAALVKGLYYSEESLAAIERQLGVANGVWPLNDESTNAAIAAIRADGLDADVHGTTLRAWNALLFDLASKALGSEAAYLDALRNWS